MPGVAGYSNGRFPTCPKCGGDGNDYPCTCPSEPPPPPPSREDEFRALVLAASEPDLARAEDHVLQFWTDGEVTSTKGGSLLGQRSLHTVARPLAVDLGHLFPSGERSIFVTDENAYRLRATARAWFATERTGFDVFDLYRSGLTRWRDVLPTFPHHP